MLMPFSKDKTQMEDIGITTKSAVAMYKRKWKKMEEEDLQSEWVWLYFVPQMNSLQKSIV